MKTGWTSNTWPNATFCSCCFVVFKIYCNFSMGTLHQSNPSHSCGQVCVCRPEMSNLWHTGQMWPVGSSEVMRRAFSTQYYNCYKWRIYCCDETTTFTFDSHLLLFISALCLNKYRVFYFLYAYVWYALPANNGNIGPIHSLNQSTGWLYMAVLFLAFCRD